MNIKNVIAMINAKLECIERDNGCNEICNRHMCDNCSLNYEQGTVREQKDCLKSAIKYLQTIDDMQTENKRLQHVFDIKDAEHAKLINENKELQDKNKKLHCDITDLQIELSDSKNDLLSCLKIADNDYKKCYAENIRLAVENNNLRRNIKNLCDENVSLRHKLYEVINNDNNY